MTCVYVCAEEQKSAHLFCLGSLQEICTDELMVAEQWCRRRSGGDGETARESERERKREDGGKLPLHPDSPCLKTQLGPTGARSAWGGEEGGKGGRVNTTRTKQRQATGSLCVFCVGG